MKFLVLFLTVIVVTLTVMPCCALAESDTVVQHKGQKDEHHSCPEKGDDCCKECSPFYVCGTCTGFTVTALSLLTGQPVIIRPAVQNGIYLCGGLTQIPTAVWQPPQLS